MKKKLSKINIFILTLTLGFMIIMQFKLSQSGIKYVSIMDIEKLTLQIETQEIENIILNNQVDQLENKILEFQNSILENGDIESVLRNEIDKYRIISGVESVVGPGVIIIVTDSVRELLEDEDPNNLIVHDLDIQALINDLKNAGAEAIAVNGQRVLPHLTEIVCNGPTVRINDEMYSQPFIIEAIGNRKYLEAAINAPDKYGYILKQWGIFIEVNTSVYLEIPGYIDRYQFKYIKAKEK